MKKLKFLLSTLLVVLLVVASAGCYVIQGQKMRNVKGTYELTDYTRTDGKTEKVTDYIQTYGYKAYLIVTGSGEGYCVFDSEETDPYYFPCTLSYKYNQEDSNIVEYVTYSYQGTTQNFGVTRNSLNFYRPVVKLSENLVSSGLSVTWKKVSKDTTLAYAKEQLGELTEKSLLSSEN